MPLRTLVVIMPEEMSDFLIEVSNNLMKSFRSLPAMSTVRREKLIIHFLLVIDSAVSCGGSVLRRLVSGDLFQIKP